MSRVAAILLGLVATAAVCAADLESTFDDPALNARYWGLIREIRCPLCLNESIADSGAPVAADLRREVHRLVAEGKSDDEVKQYLSSRYGDFVLYRPRVEPVTYALWGAPLLLLVVGGIVFGRVLIVRGKQRIDEDEAQ